ncbi:hypothetical protein [Streptomyces sp. NBC_00197]|uniref:hypothetical protein n=1 Tax=Streptomyces sp. NBC_00197 TaxID=2975676 RepID=UPI003252B31F
MRVRIEQDYYDTVSLDVLEKFVDAVKAATNDVIHQGRTDIVIEPGRLIYEREK